MCGARNLGEALRRIAEGAAMIRTKGEAGTGEGEKHKFCAKNNLLLVLHRWIMSRSSVSGGKMEPQ